MDMDNNSTQAAEQTATVEPAVSVEPTTAAVPATPSLGNGNVIAGIVGAFLFALIGGLLYFIVYQIGIIAGICGLVIFVLANFGYNLFAKGDKNTMIGLIVSIIMMIAMIFLAEYISISYAIFQAYKDYGITIFDAIRLTSKSFENPEAASAIAQDLAFAYIFGIVASISNIVNIVKARKASKAQNG